MKPSIVQRNDAVTIVYEAPGFTLTLRGQAQDIGALGDTINVLNLQSKRVVQGVVSGAGRVTVASTTTHFVQKAPEPAPAWLFIVLSLLSCGRRAGNIAAIDEPFAKFFRRREGAWRERLRTATRLLQDRGRSP
jgi:hypothetical protein